MRPRAIRDGGYAIAGLPTGTIDVECVSPEGATDPRVPLSNGREGQKSSTNVEGGGTISGVDFAFSRVVYIAGHVTDAAGKPLAGVRITAHGLEATTTQDGSYQLAGLQDGSVGPVRAEAVGMSTVQKRVRLPVGQSVVDTDFVMGPSGSLSGRIVDEEAAARCRRPPQLDDHGRRRRGRGNAASRSAACARERRGGLDGC